ncbi:MAG: WG repeat-containing protein [Cyclobacteriaceae bacterium]
MQLLLIFFLSFFTSLPVGNLDRIRRTLEKMEFDKANELLIKAGEKDNSNPGIDYFAAVLYSTEAWSNFDLDSARIIVNRAIKKFENIDEKMQLDLEEDRISRSVVEALSEEIRDRVYSDLLLELSIEKAEQFMSHYPKSPYQEVLVFKRDSIVFDQVKKNDSQGLYEDFLKKYSTTEFREQAVNRIDELRFQVLTHSGTLPDYYQFLKDHPDTRFRNEIESYVFRVSTAEHTSKSYKDFIAFARNNGLRKKAGDILYYLSDREPDAFFHPKKDSLAEMSKLKALELLPAMQSDKFGFHSTTGDLQVSYQFDDIDTRYKCSLIKDEWLLVSSGGSKKIITKKGLVLIDNVEEYNDLRYGIALVKTNSGWFLYHKSGFRIINEPIEEAAVMNARWLKVKIDGKWSLWSVSGFQISDNRFSNIETLGSFWVFEKDGLLAVYNEQLIENRIVRGLEPEFKFDDLELVSDDIIIGFREDRECMLNSKLEFLIPWGSYEINPDESGWYLRTADGYRLYNHYEQDIMNKTHPYLERNNGWLALKTDIDWILLSNDSAIEPSRGYDSLRLLSDYCTFTEKENQQSLLFSNGQTIEIDSTQTVKTFFNRAEYLLLEADDFKIVLDKEGSSLISEVYDEVTFFNDSLIKVGQDGKHGLLTLTGETFIDIEYDVLDENNSLVLCLKDGKIGCVDLLNGIQIPTISESRIERIGENYLIKKEGKYGLVDSTEATLLDFKYDEIRFWNDSSFLVRNDAEWNFLNTNAEALGEPVEFLTELVSNETESLWKYVREGKFGLLSNQNGVLLEPEFTDIFNVGSETNPVFFADQHLDKAGFHVVSYVNSRGNLILSKAYTKAEFEKILCDD